MPRERAEKRFTGGSTRRERSTRVARAARGGRLGGRRVTPPRPPRKGPLPISVEHLGDVVASVAEVQRRGKAPPGAACQLEGSKLLPATRLVGAARVG